MSESADETHLAETLVSTGKLTHEELLACFEAQRLAGGPRRKRLGEILVERGHISPLEFQETLAGSPHSKEPATPASSPTHDEGLPDHVRQALADPTRRIGRYVRLNELGRGGMGVVYRCYDTQLHRDVAVKVVRTTGQTTELDLARLEREARAAAKIRHPGIVAVHEVSEADGEPFLVMDYVEGQTFDSLLESEQVPVRRVAEVLREVALTLDHAHAAGITHRDVKPQNIMLDSGGRPLLMDFGLARDSSAQQQLTQTGQVMGTPAYMAPEQIDGSDLGHWTDVYALGAVLYHGLTGAPPFVSGNTIALFRAILMEEPRSPRASNAAVSADLETITLRCLEKEPHHRYLSAAVVADEIQRFMDGQAILARPISRSERALRWLGRNRTLSAALATVVMVVVGALAGGVYLVREAELDAARREERARLEAATEAIVKEQDRAREQALGILRREVDEALQRVRSGALLENDTDRLLARADLLKHRDPEAVTLLAKEIDQLSQRLSEEKHLTLGEGRFLNFLCETLGYLGLRGQAVPALGRYLQVEMALPKRKIDQLRAVPAGKALCLLGGERAERLLLEAREGFGRNLAFWGQVKDLFNRTGVKPEISEKTSTGYNDRGLERAEKGDLDGAIADLTRAIEIEPRDARNWNNRGILRQRRGDFDGAIADFNRAIEIAPDYPKARSHRGIARQKMGDLDGAIDDYTHAIELDPDLVQAWYNRGLARALKGDFDGAIADFSHAVELDPEDADHWSNRGAARLERGDLDGALADFTRAIEINPTRALTWANRGLARSYMDDPDGAIADFTRAIELDTSHTMTWVSRGFARRAKGDFDGAIADWNLFLEMDPGHRDAPKVRDALQRLRQQQAKAALDGK